MLSAITFPRALFRPDGRFHRLAGVRPPGRRFARRCLRLGAAIALRAEDVLIPPACGHCGGRRLARLPLCRACLRLMSAGRLEDDEVVTGLPWARALFRLTPPLHGLIHGFKYRHQKRHIDFLCAWLRWRDAWARDLAGAYDAVIPVPLHPARKRERGYNQAALLARRLALWGDCLARSDLLKRLVHTRTQTRLGVRRRGDNLDGAFVAAPGAAGLRVLLVDDVCTTGSTLAHCRDALRDAGAAHVDALVLAWVERKNDEPPLPDFSGLELAAGFFG